MDSPLNIGDLTTNSIQQRLNDTHINAMYSTEVNSAVHAGTKMIQLTIRLGESLENLENTDTNITTITGNVTEIFVLRRVQDSYVNVSQLINILQELKILSKQQANNFLKNSVLSSLEASISLSHNNNNAITHNHNNISNNNHNHNHNHSNNNNTTIINNSSNYHYNNNNSNSNSSSSSSNNQPRILNLENHENSAVRGVWVPYDMAVRIVLKFDLYDLTKELFLIDVHDYDSLPKYKKRVLDTDAEDGGFNTSIGSPLKKQKVGELLISKVLLQSNVSGIPVTNIPEGAQFLTHTLPPCMINDSQLDLVNAVKGVYGRVFKKDEELAGGVSPEEIQKEFASLSGDYRLENLKDIPLDQKGQTALHFAATLASLSLVSSLITLELVSPTRGNDLGESPLVSCVKVTNAMENGNFSDLLKNWLHSNIWLLDNGNRTILHHLALQIGGTDSYVFYTSALCEYIYQQGGPILKAFKKLILNAQDEHGMTALHIAVEREDKWFVKLLMEMGADASIPNKLHIKCLDFEILNVAAELNYQEHIFDLVRTHQEILDEQTLINGSVLPEPEEPEQISVTATATSTSTSGGGNGGNALATKNDVDESGKGSFASKLFQNLQHLLANTEHEYSSILNSKKEHIKALNQELHDITIVTANNRFQTKKLADNLATLDNLKLQAANVADKITMSRQESAGGNEIPFNENEHYDADEPFLIKPLFDRLAENQLVEELKNDESVYKTLQPTNILKARINAYKRMNETLEQELQSLTDYRELTSKFKNVVSICTHVGINDVDELLDGLLEAVEGQ